MTDTTDNATAALADGSAPMTPEALLERLDELGIQSQTATHAPVFTVEESKAVCGEIPGGHVKNLFLRNKKGAMWLVTCLEDRQIDLKALGERLGGGRLSFGSAERLMSYLGVIPGAVTPFAAINDKTGAVTVVLDRGIFEHVPVNAHPLGNDMTTALEPDDLVRFLEAENHPPEIIDFD